MTNADLESLVARFLDERDADPGLTPITFAAAHPEAGPGLVAAIRSTLEIAGLLPGEAAAYPASIGRYRVLREIGRGGMGVVFEVESSTGGCGALKLLPHAAMIGPKALERFRREVEALRSVSHDSIVAVRDWGTHGGSPYLVMDLVQGEPLAGIAGRAGTRRAAEIVRDLALALDSAHARGVLHRDLKPHNVLVRPDGRPVLVDFGLAALESEASLTSTGAVLGTPRYMSPEQAVGGSASVRSDVYGLGSILYELLVGRPAHDQASRARVLESVVAGTFPRPRTVRPEVPADLERIVLQALAWDPARRFATASDLACDLERFLAGRPVLARPPGRTSRLLRSVRASPSRSLAFAGMVLVALAGLAWGLETWRSRRNDLRRRFEEGRDRAVAAWALGNPARARREAVEAANLDPEDPECRALLAVMEPGRNEVLSGETSRIAWIPGGSALGSILRARELRAEGRSGEARELLDRRARESERSAAIRAELTSVLDELDLGTEAEGVCSEAIALDRSSPELHERLSALLFARGETSRAVEEAHAAASLAAMAGEGSPMRLLEILRRAPEPEAVREELRSRLAVDQNRTDTRFALAASYDTDHRLREARREYEDVIARDPRHAAATLYLANLRLGADRGRCRSCDESFEREPEVLDREEGTRLLLRTIELDRGRDEGVLRTTTAIAIVHALLDPVAEAFESVLARDPAGPVATRLQAALDRLHQAGAR